MNADRRKRLRQAAALLSEARELISAVQEEEQEAYDNMPESLQAGDKGTKMSETADALDTLAQELENAESGLEEACEP